MKNILCLWHTFIMVYFFATRASSPTYNNVVAASTKNYWQYQGSFQAEINGLIALHMQKKMPLITVIRVCDTGRNTFRMFSFFCS